MERLIDTAKTFEKFYGMARPGPRKQELRNRFDHILHQLVLALETELDHPAPETPDARRRRQVLMAATKRLMVVAQVGPDDDAKAAEVEDELNEADRVLARAKALVR